MKLLETMIHGRQLLQRTKVSRLPQNTQALAAPTMSPANLKRTDFTLKQPGLRGTLKHRRPPAKTTIMAPVEPRQSRPLPPQENPENPPQTTRDFSSYISAKIFFQLFAGTFCIFFIGVFFWKFGEFLRFLTRDRVLGAGDEGNRKAADVRYARTWYGWVPLPRHEANKEFFRRVFARIRRWTAWRSSRDSHRWVWWDPGGKELGRHEEDQRALRWLPGFLRSYRCTPADAIWNPGPPPSPSSFELKDGLVDTVDAKGVSSGRSRWTPVSRWLHSSTDRLRSGRGRLDSRMFESEESPIVSRGEQNPHDQRSTYDISSVRKGKRPVRGSNFNLKGSCSSSLGFQTLPRRKDVSLRSKQRDSGSRWAASASLPSLLNPSPKQRRYHALSDSSGDAHLADDYMKIAEKAKTQRFSRKYQVWSARMQVQTSKLARDNPQEIQEPPGSPGTDFLASLSSERSDSVDMLRQLRREIADRLSSQYKRSISTSPGRELDESLIAEIDDVRRDSEEVPLNWDYRPRAAQTVPLVRPRAHAIHDVRDWFSDSFVTDSQKEHTGLDPQIQDFINTLDQRRNSIPIEKLSDWEVQLMYNLDRRLEWLLNEIDPGRKPFHFPILAAHWLNTKCWQVTDPTSRLSLEAQRQLGDSRFNNPYPEPTFEPKHKYPMRIRRRVRTPRIDSWRAAVNQQRQEGGVMGIRQIVEFLESSADEPPDGKVDPACWILRKPPQGFGMSNKQKDAFYGSGTGWQEKLGDWHSVRRGYRVRKAIHEGRANRTRVKEIGTGITRKCRIASSKLQKDRRYRGSLRGRTPGREDFGRS